MTDTTATDYAYEDTLDHGEAAQDIVVSGDVNSAIVYMSVRGDSFEDKKRIYNALTTENRLGDFLNEPLEVVDIVAGRVEMTNEETGEVTTPIRTIIITSDGKAYGAISSVLYQRLMQICGIFGHPSSWETPLLMKIRQVNTRGGYRIYVPEII